jgi:hypothetical protein
VVNNKQAKLVTCLLGGHIPWRRDVKMHRMSLTTTAFLSAVKNSYVIDRDQRGPILDGVHMSRKSPMTFIYHKRMNLVVLLGEVASFRCRVMLLS